MSEYILWGPNVGTSIESCFFRHSSQVCGGELFVFICFETSDWISQKLWILAQYYYILHVLGGVLGRYLEYLIGMKSQHTSCRIALDATWKVYSVHNSPRTSLLRTANFETYGAG